MTTITLSAGHPVTVVANDAQRYYFGKLMAAADAILVVQLRKPIPQPGQLEVSSLIVETYGQFATERLGTVLIQFECRNVANHGPELLRLQFQNPHLLQIRIGATAKTSDD